MKFAGLGLIAASCLYCGLVILKSKKTYIDGLYSMCRALEIMQGELTARLTPMPELIKILSEGCTDCAKSFFAVLYEFLPELGNETFSDLWKQAAEKELGGLKEEDQREIIAMGSILGRYELSEQTKAINRCLIALRESYSNVLSEYPGTRKLCIGLSGAAGILLTIVLI